MRVSDSFLTQIKAVHENCFNNGSSKNFSFPWSKTGIFKTPTMITCLDNRRRRVWCNASHSSYYLFVKMEGERVILAENQYFYSNFACLDRLVVEC